MRRASYEIPVIGVFPPLSEPLCEQALKPSTQLTLAVLYRAQAPRQKHQHDEKRARLVEALGGRHGSLDGQASNVLPALLQQGDEVVDGQHDVGDQLLLGHADVADGDTHAENLLQLELDGGLDLGDLAREIVGVGDGVGNLPAARLSGTVFRREVQGSDGTYPWTDRDPRDGGSA